MAISSARQKNRGGQAAAGTASVTRRHRPDHRLVLFMGLLVMIGLVVLFAISPYQIHRINQEGGSLDQGHYMLKQLTYLLLGGTAFVIGSLMPMSLWRRFAGTILLSALGVCALLALLGALSLPPAFCFNGACRWFDFGIISFQPAEFLKFAVLIFGSAFLASRIAQKKIDNIQDTLMPIGIVAALVVFFVIGLQKDMGTGLTILGVIAAMLVVSGVSLRLLGLAGAAAVGLGLLFVVLSPHRMERVMTFFNSSATDASSYHIDMAKLAIGSGGLFGRGLGNGVQAFGYLPEALNDSIFAVLGEIFGFVGLVIIIGLFGALLVRIMHVSERLQDPLMRLLAAGVFGWLTTHVIVNIGAMTGVMPLTGVTLPFLSFGGTSLLSMMAALGVVYHVSKYTSFRIVNEGGSHEATGSRRGFGGSRYSGTRRNQRAR